MRVKLELPLSTEKDSTFADGVAESLIGQTTKDGQKIIDAKQVEPGLIILTIDFDVPKELEQMFQPKEM